MLYALFEHRHRFSVWAAARATQRGFTSVDNLRDAIDTTDLRDFVLHHAHEPINDNDFNKRHRVWCGAITESLIDLGVANTHFGRAAKLVAVYLKTMVVLGQHSNNELARIAHPPIDSILLKGIAGLEGLSIQVKKLFCSTRWTQLESDEYYSLIEKIKESIPKIEPFWHLERFWTVTQDAEF